MELIWWLRFSRMSFHSATPNFTFLEYSSIPVSLLHICARTHAQTNTNTRHQHLYFVRSRKYT
jgi:hypothetical protein